MTPDVDYPEREQPIIITHEQARISVWVVIARAVVSFTLLAVLLLAFGVAISGWFLGNSIRQDVAAEIERTPIQAQMVIAYRDALIGLTERMETERSVLASPSDTEIYEQVLEDRQGHGATLGGASLSSLQGQIDLMQRDNADLRWADSQLRQQAVARRNPSLPRRNQAP